MLVVHRDGRAPSLVAPFLLGQVPASGTGTRLREQYLMITHARCERVPAGGRRLRLLAQAPFMMCMVTDPGSDIPVLRESEPTSESGRGLNVVEACSVRWGWHLLDEGGKVVWALLRPPI